jgi:hypothetical protein
MPAEMESMLESLPLELLLEIFSYVDLADIKNIRLASSILRSAAAGLLFQRIYISAHPLDLEVFKYITRDENLRRGVQEIVYDDSLSDLRRSMLDFDSFQSRLDDPPKFLFPITFPRETLLQAYDFWDSIVSGDRIVVEKNLDGAALRDALPLLPRLRKVTMTIMSFSGTTDTPNTYHMRTPMSPTVRQWMNLKDLLIDALSLSYRFEGYSNRRWLAAAQLDKRMHEIYPLQNIPQHSIQERVQILLERPIEPLDFPNPLVSRGARTVFGAFKDATFTGDYQPLRSFKIGSDSIRNAIYHGLSPLIFTSNHSEIKGFGIMLKNLEKLSLKFVEDGSELSVSMDERKAYTPGFEAALSKLLSETSSLQEIVLEASNRRMCEILSREKPHPNLRSLCLKFGLLDRESLISFLEQHKSTLRDLYIEGCGLTSGRWEEVFTSLKMAGGFGLERCWIRHAIDADGTKRLIEGDGEMMMKYLRNTRRSPLLRLREF